MGIYNLVSFLGIFILLAVAWAISTNRKNVNFRVVIWAIVIQLVLGAFVFQVPAGTKVFLYVNDIVIKVLDSATAGAEFLFGGSPSSGAEKPPGEESLGFSSRSRASLPLSSSLL